MRAALPSGPRQPDLDGTNRTRRPVRGARGGHRTPAAVCARTGHRRGSRAEPSTLRRRELAGQERCADPQHRRGHPLLAGGRHRLAERWSVRADLDGLAGGPGRAIDLGVGVDFSISDRWQIGAEARVPDGGADTDEVYNFARLDSAALAVSTGFRASAQLASFRARPSGASRRPPTRRAIPWCEPVSAYERMAHPLDRPFRVLSSIQELAAEQVRSVGKV